MRRGGNEKHRQVERRARAHTHTHTVKFTIMRPPRCWSVTLCSVTGKKRKIKMVWMREARRKQEPEKT